MCVCETESTQSRIFNINTAHHTLVSRSLTPSHTPTPTRPARTDRHVHVLGHPVRDRHAHGLGLGHGLRGREGHAWDNREREGEREGERKKET